MSYIHSRIWKWLLFGLLLVIGLAFAPHVLAADGIAVVDQEQTYQWLTNDLAYYAPVGQEFTPSLAGLDAVEVRLVLVGHDSGPKIEIRIREQTIDGSLVATSLPLIAEAGVIYSGFVGFEFPDLVSLKPGALYVLEIVDISDTGIANYQSRGEDQPDYPGGRSISVGVPNPNTDLCFREGLASSEPRTKAYCRNGLWQHLTRADGSKFKNQGDCIQYVNTGK